LETFYKFLEEEREIDRRIRWKREKYKICGKSREKEKEYQRLEKERLKKDRERL
jgi:hypothetical protein